MSTPKAPTPAEQAMIDALAAMNLRWEESQVRMARSLGGTLLRGAQPVPIGVSAGGTTRPSLADGSLMGFAVRETTGVTPATVELRAHDAAGDLIVPINLAAGASTRDWFAGGGINFADGLFVVVTGSVDGAVFLRGRDE
jgi:hypothetical protein